MFGWLSSKVVTTMAVLVIAASFTGLFSMQADYYRTLELEDLANAITDLVTEVDLLSCQATVTVNWTSQAASHGRPRDFHGEPYLVQFTSERPYVVWQGTRVTGRFFPSDVALFQQDGSPSNLLEVASTTGFIISSEPVWKEWGLDQEISIQPIE
jgi:hypothetical protein